MQKCWIRCVWDIRDLRLSNWCAHCTDAPDNCLYFLHFFFSSICFCSNQIETKQNEIVSEMCMPALWYNQKVNNNLSIMSAYYDLPYQIIRKKMFKEKHAFCFKIIILFVHLYN